MFAPQAKSTGTQFTTTVALLAMAVLFCPALLVLSGHIGYPAISLALAGSACFLALAWVSWTKYSRLTIPSIETPVTRGK
jgi:hypothetical protein